MEPARPRKRWTVPPIPELSEEQEEAVRAVMAALSASSGREAVLVGPAGTGKTTILRAIASRWKRGTVLLAPTGKAALRIEQVTGKAAITIHKAIYADVQEFEVWRHGGTRDERLIAVRLTPDRAEARHGRDGGGVKVLGVVGGDPLSDPEIEIEEGSPAAEMVARDATRYAEETAEAAAAGFTPTSEIRPRFGDRRAPCLKGELVIVDEASMVGTTIYRDFMAVLPPTARVLWCGDREQLPPVNDSWGPNLRDPTFALEKVHRQAAGSPVIRLATAVRLGESLPPPDPEDPRYVVIRCPDLDAPARWLAEARERGADATLVTFTNATRQSLNGLIRHYRGLASPPGVPGAPVPGDTIVALQNAPGWRNGEIFTVLAAEVIPPDTPWRGPAGSVVARLVPFGTEIDGDLRAGTARACWERDELREVRLNPALIGVDQGNFREWVRLFPYKQRDGWMHYDFGDALTAHKCQGSQWKWVGIVWDSAVGRLFKRDPGGDGKRWLYTAATRAAENLTVFVIGAGR